MPNAPEPQHAAVPTTPDDRNVQSNGTEALLVLTKLRYYGAAKWLRPLADNLIGWRLGTVVIYLAFIAIFVLFCKFVLGYGWVFFVLGIPAAFMLIALHYVPSDGDVSAGYLQAAEQSQSRAVQIGRRVLINRLGWVFVAVVASAALSLILGYGISALSTQARAVARENEVERQRHKTEALNRLKEAAKLFEQDQKKQQAQEAETRKRQAAEAEADHTDTLKSRVWTATKEMVLEHLKSPATADFHDGFFEGDQGFAKNVTVDGEVFSMVDIHVFSVNGYVDSQNGFGATVRCYFSAKLRLDHNGKLLDVIQPLQIVER